MSFLYFAYGSNMLSSRLKNRCSSAKKLFVATADNFELNFSKRSNDGSGKGGIKSKTGSIVLGVVFQISDCDLPALDRAEGKGYGYERINDFQVSSLKEGQVLTTTYIATDVNPNLKVYDWYLALVLAGAIENEFPRKYIKNLRSAPFEADPCKARKSRVVAPSNYACFSNWFV